MGIYQELFIQQMFMYTPVTSLIGNQGSEGKY